MERGVPRLQRCAAVLSSPWFVLCLAVLVLNDRWWKSAYPGIITGKLSDFAGVVVAALLIATVAHVAGVGEVRAIRGSVVVTAAAFFVMKTSDTGARLAESAWTAINGGPNGVTADPTDLVALVMLGVVPLAWRSDRAAHGDRRPGIPGANLLAGRQGVSRVLRVAAAIAAFSIGTLAATATSCQSVDSVNTFGYAEGTIFAADPEGVVIARSTDGGSTWVDDPWGLRPEELEERASTSTTVDPAAIPPTSEPVATTIPKADRRPQPKACEGSTCWVIRNGRVYREEGTERTEELAAVTDRYLQTQGCGPTRQAVVESVGVFPRPSGGSVVVAALGTQGLAVREADGRWHRAAVGYTHIPSGFGQTWPLPVVWYVFALVVAALFGALGFAVTPAPARIPESERTGPSRSLVAFTVVTLAGALATGAWANDAIRESRDPVGFVAAIFPLWMGAVVAGLAFFTGHKLRRGAVCRSRSAPRRSLRTR